MIQLLATGYTRRIAFLLFTIFLYSHKAILASDFNYPVYSPNVYPAPVVSTSGLALPAFTTSVLKDQSVALKDEVSDIQNITANKKADENGGPGQPEMSSFKSISANNMVNLFTGDFSYNIPLMDVGGYPVNIFYDGGITPEQEASWVGLGWNINPGNVNRNMRGIPDDFNGEDKMIQTQMIKPNITWGFDLGANFELFGLDKLNVGVGTSMGFSYNNYLGPALQTGVQGNVALQIIPASSSEKFGGVETKLGFSASGSSRYGFSFSPSVSLSAKTFNNERSISTGAGLSTSYNSRVGVKQLQLFSQMSYNYKTAARSKDQNGYSSSMGGTLKSTSINFAKPSYIPAIRMPVTNQAYSGNFQLGTGAGGGFASAQVEAFKQISKIELEDAIQTKGMVGYIYYDKAANDPNLVMDFTRYNDNEVRHNTPVISVPQYTYDVFSIQGEGTGGSIRAYRNDQGYVRDNLTKSKDKSFSAGADIGIPGHYGANFNVIKTPTIIGEWVKGNKLKSVDGFGFKESEGINENVYFRNPGETSVIDENQYEKIGGVDLVRYKLGGTNAMPTIEPILERFSMENKLTDTTHINTALSNERVKRSQVINFLTAKEAADAGLDKTIKSYNRTTVLELNKLKFSEIDRISEYRKSHHISQINVTEQDGKRYIYGIPVYNTKQKDFTFSVENAEHASSKDRVAFNISEATTNSQHLASNSDVPKDGYLQITEMPAYAHSFLLSGLLTPDYVDVTGDGISEDDLGNAVKFNYSKETEVHKWRTPLADGAIANFIPGALSETKDDKGVISYGERESWYMHSIESKTMIALFTVNTRADGKGALDSLQGRDTVTANNASKKLEKIDLYSKSDLVANGIENARPIKTVWFKYSYALSANTPSNTNGGGKLTLDSIYFTYNGQQRSANDKYVFAYGNNPDNEFNSSDRWGNYKPAGLNPASLKNADYPYAIQTADADTINLLNQNAAAWSLSKILLPSGGEIELEYESDDYAFVQNRRAASMMQIVGIGAEGGSMTNKLYLANALAYKAHDIVYVKVPEPCSNKAEVLTKYLDGIDQIAFKLAVKMPKGVEFIKCYGTIFDYGVTDNETIWIKLDKIDGHSPMALAAIDYLKEHLPGQAFSPAYDLSESTGIEQVGKMLVGMLSAFKESVQSPVAAMQAKGYAQEVILNQSFLRLNVPGGYKSGGGHRVRSVKLSDNWEMMTGQYTSTYGQTYDYTTSEFFNGEQRTISSGVASYEPSFGGEENPFQSIFLLKDKLPLGPASYSAIENPVMDAFFNAPVVGYSKVTIRSVISGVIPVDKKSRSGIGKQVTEFYTAKDFPVFYNYTSLDHTSDKREDINLSQSFFNKYSFNSRAISQGFLIALNDMHGKMKAQISFGEADTLSPVNHTEHFYRNTGEKGLSEKFDFVSNVGGGVVKSGNMGIDVEMMTDVREFNIKTSSKEVQGQIDIMSWLPPVILPFIWPVFGTNENVYRAVTTTKVVNYHGILDRVVVMDKGSEVSTQNLAYDAETGAVIVNQTNNEYDLPVYSVNYPAYWAYSGMGPSYKNIDASYADVNFLDGKIVSGIDPTKWIEIFESGDELLIIYPGNIPAGECGALLNSGSDVKTIWALDKNKNVQSLTNNSPDLIFIDSVGNPYSRSNIKFRIIRSGKRNMLAAQLSTVVTMKNPISDAPIRKLSFSENNKVVNASSIIYREKWQTDRDIIDRYSTQYNSATCTYEEILDCNGYLDKRINPYRKGLLGNFRSETSLVFYNYRKDDNQIFQTKLSKDGFLKDFKLYWDFTGNNLLPSNHAEWVWNNKVTRANSKGLEMETKDALNIYTAAQYGYNKTMPVAMTNNSMYNEMFYQGFEDYNYQQNISNTKEQICADQFLDLYNMPNTSIINTKNLNFDAHTGDYVMSLNANSTATKSIPVSNSIIDSFKISYTKDTTKSLSVIGGNVDEVWTYPQNMLWGNNYDYVTQNTYFSGGSSLGASMSFNPADTFINVNHNAYTREHSYWSKVSQYFQVTNFSNYNLQINVGGSPSEVNYAYVNIQGIDNDFTNSFGLNGWNCCSSEQFSVALCPGKYKITFYISNDYSVVESGTNPYQISHHNTFSYSLNVNTQTYKDLSTQNGCITTIPLAATYSMLHPSFKLAPEKNMLLSAWVREECSLPCDKSSYESNKIVVQFPGTGITIPDLKPTGFIINGWQRYESAFEVPSNATTMNLSFVNTGSNNIYFDDIRIHPFNANMKSYVYDPVNLKLTAELDANNYATFYEYDAEGNLIRTKVETERGIKTINETRSYKQTVINELE